MELTFREFRHPDSPQLREMYLEFDPKGAFQGLPPETTTQLDEWLRRVFADRVVNFVIDDGGRIVGHAMLCPGSGKTEAEVAIFVHQDWRGRRAGRTLLLGTLNHGCKQLQLDRVWLSVQGSNPHARHLFESVGFRPVGEEQPFAWELELARPSQCAKCEGDRCEVFGAALPRVVRLD